MANFLKEGDYTKVYVDGSCLDAGTSKARAGYGVVFNLHHPE